MPGVGDPCPEMYGWPILAFREQCPEHGCTMYDLRGKRTNHYNICPQCWRAKKREYAKRYREQHDFHYVADHIVEGHKDIYLRLWSKKADKKIDEFWSMRVWNGQRMTDEIAKEKFALKIRT